MLSNLALLLSGEPSERTGSQRVGQDFEFLVANLRTLPRASGDEHVLVPQSTQTFRRKGLDRLFLGEREVGLVAVVGVAGGAPHGVREEGVVVAVPSRILVV